MLFEGAIGALRPGAGFADYLVLVGIVAASIVAILLVTGAFFEFINARHPERKIQTRVNKNKWRELAYAPGSISMISITFAGGLFCQWQGWSMTPLPLTWWSIPLTLGASMLLYDTWFYWIHRLLHWKPMYRFHTLHHTSVAPTVWTNHHETIVEGVLNQSFYTLIVFVLPIAWPVLVAQKIYDQVSGMLGHAGYEHFASPLARKPWPLACTVFHDQHHGYFRYNFAHTFSVWDRWMGTLHPTYDTTVERFERIDANPKAAGSGQPV